MNDKFASERDRVRSKNLKNRWRHPEKRRILLDSIKKGKSKIIGPLGATILKILKEGKELFIRDIRDQTGFSKNLCNQVVLKLHERNLIDRKKDYNPDGQFAKVQYYKYRLTNKGKEIINNQQNIKYRRNLPAPPKGKRSKKLGKNQIMILKLLTEKSILSRWEIVDNLSYLFKETNGYPKIYNSLKRMVLREILKMDIIKKGKNVIKYQYTITEQGHQLLNLNMS